MKRRAIFQGLLLAPMLVAAVGCSDEGGESKGIDLEQYTGMYADRATIGQTMTSALGRSSSVTTFHGLTEIVLDGGELIAQQIGCHCDVTSDATVYGEIPDAVLATTPPMRRRMVVTEDGGELRGEGQEAIAILGAKLEDPANETLPTSPDDPRVWDQDEDGHPGVTIQLVSSGKPIGSLYAVWRQVDSWSGVMAPDGSLTGVITDASQQSIISGDNPAIAESAKESQIAPDPSKNSYRLIPIDRKMDCAELMARRTEIFVDE